MLPQLQLPCVRREFEAAATIVKTRPVMTRSKQWTNDSSIQVMVCTSAFSMGVYVPNIDLVIKIGCPSSVEELVQMFGRAGRDGKAKGTLQLVGFCTCISDVLRVMFMILDNCVFTYIPVQAFSCIQSQTSKMLPSGVRD